MGIIITRKRMKLIVVPTKEMLIMKRWLPKTMVIQKIISRLNLWMLIQVPAKTTVHLFQVRVYKQVILVVIFGHLEILH